MPVWQGLLTQLRMPQADRPCELRSAPLSLRRCRARSQSAQQQRLQEVCTSCVQQSQVLLQRQYSHIQSCLGARKALVARAGLAAL